MYEDREAVNISITRSDTKVCIRTARRIRKRSIDRIRTTRRIEKRQNNRPLKNDRIRTAIRIKSRRTERIRSARRTNRICTAFRPEAE